MRILFVCSGNICRSPFAEALARRLVTEPGVACASAGTIARGGDPATAAGIAAADEFGIDLRSHRATHLSSRVLAKADVIYAMEAEHVASVLALDAGAAVELLDPAGEGIPDPYGGDHHDYRASYAMIRRALERRFPATAQPAGPPPAKGPMLGPRRLSMNEFHTPPMVEVDPSDNAIAALFHEAERHPNRPAISSRQGDVFVDVSLGEFAANVRKLAAGLVSLGIEPGSRIALHSGTRPEFTYFDYAIWAAGCVTVPIYETSSEEQVEWIIGNSEAVAVISETQGMKDTFDAVADSIPTCKHSIVIEHGGFDHLIEAGASVDPAEVDRRWQAITQDDLATLVYTSGTTGRPKGCMLTHRNFIFIVRQLVAAVPPAFHEGSSTLFFLPLAHIFARAAQVSCITAGVKLGYSTGVPKLLEELAIFQPTWLFSVPRVFEKVYNSAQQKAHAEGKGKIFDYAAKVAEEFSRQRQEGRVKPLTKVQHAIFDRLVYSKLRAAFGGRVAYAISGGAALGERLGHFFTGVGIHILEGYGLTETTAGSTLNRPDATEVGSVGPPIPGVTVAIADDGEVLVKGPHIMKGYFKNDAATAESINVDGWFHTGDIGELDAAGFLRITGRKKEILVTAAGKNVAPAVIEDRIRAHALISQAMVVGDGEKFIACLITIDPDAFPAWAAEHGKADATIASLVDDPDLRATVQEAIDDGNKAVSRAEAVREFRILPNDFTIDSGEMTPTLKLRRAEVMKKYAGVVEDIYR